MTRDDIKRMAHKSGLIEWFNSKNDEYIDFANCLDKFANLVATAERERMEYDGIHNCNDECQRPACVAVREAVKEERKACARIAFYTRNYWEAAEAIRTRGEK